MIVEIAPGFCLIASLLFSDAHPFGFVPSTKFRKVVRTLARKAKGGRATALAKFAMADSLSRKSRRNRTCRLVTST